jgi:hypothetical protein
MFVHCLHSVFFVIIFFISVVRFISTAIIRLIESCTAEAVALFSGTCKRVSALRLSKAVLNQKKEPTLLCICVANLRRPR